MATEQGIVTKVGSSTAHVKTIRSSACESCAMKEGCHTHPGGGKEMEVEAINCVDARVGDKVVIGFETSSLMKASFLVYIFPILSMIAGAVIGQEIGPNYDIDPSVLSVVLGFLFFFLAFVLIRRMGAKLAEEEKYRVKIIRIKKRKDAGSDVDASDSGVCEIGLKGEGLKPVE